MKSVTAGEEEQVNNTVSMISDSKYYNSKEEFPIIDFRYLREASIIQTQQR